MADAAIIPDSEIWKPIPSLPGFEASNIGRIRALPFLANSKRVGQPTQRRSGAIIKGEMLSSGYRAFKSKRVETGVRVRYLVHRLVCEAFHGKPDFDDATVDHIDGDRLNNRADNLEWVTRSENSRRQNASGRGAPKGEKHPTAKLTDFQAEAVFRLKREGWAAIDISRLLRVSSSLVYGILIGKKRPHVSASASTSSTLRNQPLPKVGNVGSER